VVSINYIGGKYLMLDFCLIRSVADCARFCMVSYCGNTRRISVGAKNGSLAVYDLKQSKCQVSVVFVTRKLNSAVYLLLSRRLYQSERVECSSPSVCLFV